MATPLEQINARIEDIEEDFSELVDIIYQCERLSEDSLPFVIVSAVNALPIKTRLEYLIRDLHEREDKKDQLESEMVHYSSIWYSIAESPESRAELIRELSQVPRDSYVFDFLAHLDEGDVTPGEAGIREALSAIGIAMPLPEQVRGKVTRKRLWVIKKDVCANFSELIDALIYYDRDGPSGFAWQVIHAIEDLPIEKEVSLLIADFNTRGVNTPKSNMYLSLWVELFCDEDRKNEVLRQLLLLEAKARVLAYLNTLVDNDGSVADANILAVLAEINRNETTVVSRVESN